MRFAIFGNRTAQKSVECENSISALLQSLGHEILPQDRLSETDIIISIGGDGTFLRTAALVGDKGIPMIGINTGRLGFLADVTSDRMEEAVRMIHEGRYTIQQRHLLQLETEGLPAGHTPYALNDIAILKHDISSMISVSASIDGTPLTTYQADGLVIATSTGSTAYSLSVGGPIVAPGSNVTVLTPVAPHSLNMRPMVLPAARTISLDVSSRSHNFLISIDGRSFSCKEHTPMLVRRAPYFISVIRLEGSNFYSTLREKMLWGTDARK